MGPYRQSQLTTFTYSLGFRITWALLMLFPIFVLAAEPQRWRECLLGIAIFAVGNVVFNAEKVSIDEKMITYRGFIGWSTSIEWSEVFSSASLQRFNDISPETCLVEQSQHLRISKALGVKPGLSHET